MQQRQSDILNFCIRAQVPERQAYYLFSLVGITQVDGAFLFMQQRRSNWKLLKKRLHLISDFGSFVQSPIIN